MNRDRVAAAAGGKGLDPRQQEQTRAVAVDPQTKSLTDKLNVGGLDADSRLSVDCVDLGLAEIGLGKESGQAKDHGGGDGLQLFGEEFHWIVLFGGRTAAGRRAAAQRV